MQGVFGMRDEARSAEEVQKLHDKAGIAEDEISENFKHACRLQTED